MKSTPFVCRHSRFPGTLALFIALSSSFLLQADSDPPFWGSVHSVTVALTVTYSQPSLKAKDYDGKVIAIEDGGGLVEDNQFTIDTFNRKGDITKRVDTYETGHKNITVKIGNAEIIKSLCYIGALPALSGDDFASPSGWTLVALDEDGGTHVYARHAASKTLVEAYDISINYDDGSSALSGGSKTVTTTTYPTNGDSKETTSYSGDSSIKATGYGSVLIQDGATSVTGIYTESGSKYVIKTDTVDGYKYDSEIFVRGACKLDKIAGAGTYRYLRRNDPDYGPDYDDAPAIVEGSISFGSGAIINYNTY